MDSKRKVLVADEQASARALLVDSLKIRYDVLECSAENVFTTAFDCVPDLIIMDVEISSGAGLDICKKLKDEEKTRNIPVLLITSRTNKQDIINGLQAGADDYLPRPLYAPEVLARVDAHLRSKGCYDDLEHRDLLMLLELSESISASRNPMKILRLIVEKMSDVIDVARCSIVSVNGKDDLIVKASSDLPKDGKIRIDLRKYPEIKKALATREAVVVNDIKNDPLMDSVRNELKEMEFNSIVVIPIVKKESVIGTFFLRTASPITNGITERVYRLCQLVANISANALESATLFESMKMAQEYFEEMSIRDGLTKLYNYRHFHNRLDEEFSRATRYQTQLSCVFFDVDDFKAINDIHGHTIGDDVLREIGSIVKHVARESDVPARYGGDEFAILLPNTTAEGALNFTTRLGSIVREHTFQTLKEWKVTISAGVSTFVDGNVLSFEQLLQLADSAMYNAKMGGKDRVSHADGITFQEGS